MECVGANGKPKMTRARLETIMEWIDQSAADPYEKDFSAELRAFIDELLPVVQGRAIESHASNCHVSIAASIKCNCRRGMARAIIAGLEGKS